MNNKTYIQFLVDSGYYPKRYTYGITESMRKKTEAELKDNPKFTHTRTGEEHICWYEIGFMHTEDANVEVKSIGSVSVEFEMNVLGMERTFRVYCHTGVSPKEFYIRAENALRKQYTDLKTGDEDFAKLKEAHDYRRKNMFKGLSLKKVSLDNPTAQEVKDAIDKLKD